MRITLSVVNNSFKPAQLLIFFIPKYSRSNVAFCQIWSTVTVHSFDSSPTCELPLQFDFCPVGAESLVLGAATMAEGIANLVEFNLITVESGVLDGTLQVIPSQASTSARSNVSTVWTVLQKIQTAAGVLVPKFVWCPRCKKPLIHESSSGTNKLRSHLKNCIDPAANEDIRKNIVHV